MRSSIQFQIKKVLKNRFCSFWQDLGFGECVFSIQFQIKKVLKNQFCSFWQDLGFGECVFAIQFQHEAIVEPLDLHIHHVDKFPLVNSLQISQIEYSDRPRWFV